MWQILLTLLWGLVVLASFVSLGRLLVRALDPPLLVDLPLTAGIGMAGMVFIGGILDLAHTASSGVLVALIVALVVVEALVSFRSRRRPARVDRRRPTATEVSRPPPRSACSSRSCPSATS